jgi:tetratricopeptide (TPR) repeat protein
VTSSERTWRRGFQLFGGAVAVAILTQISADLLQRAYATGGWVGRAGIAGAVLLLVIAAIYWWKSKMTPAPPPDPALRKLAEEAEHRLVDLGSDANGMSAMEWFTEHEPALRAALKQDPEAEHVDDAAHICDALEAWYLRTRSGPDLQAVAERLSAVGEQAGRRDLEEVAAARIATALRLIGDAAAANTWLGTSEGIAPRSRSAAAMHARRNVEWALLHLDHAERSEPGKNREEQVLIARDRLDDAAAELPRADADADIAVRLNLGVVELYRDKPALALDHLLVAAARARQVHNASLHAHALELAGVAAWTQGNRPQAAAWWGEATRLYADVADREGHGRCLQHEGSAALAGGNPGRALALLEESTRLRGRTSDLAMRYLAEAGRAHGHAAASDSHPRPVRVAGFRRFLQWLVGK